MVLHQAMDVFMVWYLVKHRDNLNFLPFKMVVLRILMFSVLASRNDYNHFQTE
jgi:hypothetical protein